MAKDFNDAATKVLQYANSQDVILVMGAGDVYEVSSMLLI